MKKVADTNFQKILGVIPDAVGAVTQFQALAVFAAACVQDFPDKTDEGRKISYSMGLGYMGYIICWFAAVIRVIFSAVTPVPGGGVGLKCIDLNHDGKFGFDDVQAGLQHAGKSAAVVGQKAVAGVTDVKHKAVAGVKDVGHKTVAGVTDVKHKAVAGVKDVGHKTVAGVTDVKHKAVAGVKDVGHKTVAGVRDVGHKALTGVAEAGQRRPSEMNTSKVSPEVSLPRGPGRGEASDSDPDMVFPSENQ